MTGSTWSRRCWRKGDGGYLFYSLLSGWSGLGKISVNVEYRGVHLERWADVDRGEGGGEGGLTKVQTVLAGPSHLTWFISGGLDLVFQFKVTFLPGR